MPVALKFRRWWEIPKSCSEEGGEAGGEVKQQEEQNSAQRRDLGPAAASDRPVREQVQNGTKNTETGHS